MLKNVTVGNTSFQVYHAGSGAPLLFVHGFPLDHTMWQGQLDEFTRGYQVIAPDLRGFGGSGGTRNMNSMASFASDLTEILDVLEVTEPVTFCGLSMGGYIGFQFASQYSERLSRLVLCDTRAQSDSDEAFENRQAVAERVLHEGPAFLAEALPEKLFAPSILQSQPELVEETRNVIRKTDSQAIAAASLGMANRPDSRGLLGNLKIPTLVVCGVDDAIAPLAEMREMAAAIPQAEFAEIPDAGHMAPLENPQAFNDALQQFLSRTDV